MFFEKDDINTRITMVRYGEPGVFKILDSFLRELPPEISRAFFNSQDIGMLYGDNLAFLVSIEDKLVVEQNYRTKVEMMKDGKVTNEEMVVSTKGFEIYPYFTPDNRFDMQMKFYEKVQYLQRPNQPIETNYVMVKTSVKNKKNIFVTYEAQIDFLNDEWVELDKTKYNDMIGLIDLKHGVTTLAYRNSKDSTLYYHKSGEFEFYKGNKRIKEDSFER